MKTTYHLARYSNGTADLTINYDRNVIVQYWDTDHTLYCTLAHLPLTCAHAHVILHHVDIRAAWSPTL